MSSRVSELLGLRRFRLPGDVGDSAGNSPDGECPCYGECNGLITDLVLSLRYSRSPAPARAAPYRHSRAGIDDGKALQRICCSWVGSAVQH